MLNRQFKKMISALLVFFVLLTGVPFPEAYATDLPTASLTSSTTNAPQAVYGNPFRVTVKISNVTDSVYQQVYEHEATVNYDPDQLELTEVLAPYNTFEVPVQTAVSPGKVKVYNKLIAGKAGYAFSSGTRNFSVFIFKPKASGAYHSSVSVSDITITNGQGNKLELNNASYTINVVPAGNKSSLNALINQAQSAYDAAVEGTETGQYPAGSKNALKTAIQKANATAKGIEGNTTLPNQPQAALNQALAELQAAFDVFQALAIGTNGEYSLNFTAMHATKDEASSMDKYFLKPGKLTVQGNTKKVSFTVKDSTTVSSLKVQQNGAMVETAILSTDTVANTRVVEFPVSDLNALLNAQVHISTTLPGGGAYEMDHSIRLKFDIGGKTQLNALIANAQAAHDAAVEGSANGQYPAGSKITLKAAIDQAKAAAANVGASQSQVDQAAADLQTALGAFKASVNTGTPSNPDLQDGVYDIGFTIYKKGTSDSSVMYDYVIPESGKLSVQGGKKYVSFTLKQSKEILSFKTQQNGALAETTVVSKDEAANTRVVQFPVDDLTVRVNGWVKIYWQLTPDFLYDNEYDVEIGFSNLPTNPSNSVNKSTLNQTIAAAQAAYDAAVEGTENGQYPGSAKNALQTAINNAKAVANDTGATQQQVDRAVEHLQASLGTFQASVINKQSLPEGEYLLDYAIYKKGTNDNSVMYDYVVKDSGKLTVQGGKKYVSFTLKQSAEILSFKTLQNGALAETTTVSSDPASNTRTVQFEVDNLTSRLNGWVKIYWDLGPPIGLYDHEYDVELSFSNLRVDLTKPVKDGQYSFSFTAASDDPSGAPIHSYLDTTGGLKVQNGKKLASFKLKSGVTITKIQMLKSDNTVQDILPQYAVKQAGLVRVLANEEAAKEVQFEVDDLTATYIIQLIAGGGASTEARTFKLAFDKVVPVGTVTTPTTPTTPTNPGGGTGGGGGGTIPNTSSMAAGTYSINYKILKYGTDEKSVMQDYVITPATLKVEGGKQYITLTLKQSKEITQFQTELGGSLTDTAVVSRNETRNTRDVQFEVPDLSAKLKGWVKVDWPEFNYFHSYDVDISFDKSSIKKLSGTDLAIGGGAAIAALKDGEYDLDFTVLQHRSNLESRINDYIAHPGKLIVKGEKKSIVLQLTRNNEITDFKIETEKATESGSSSANKKIEKEMVSATAENVNEAENTRSVKFEVKDVTATLHAVVTMVKKVSGNEADGQTAGNTEANGEDGSDQTASVPTENIDVDIMFHTDAFGQTKEEQEQAANPAAQLPTGSSSGAPTLSDIQDHWAKSLIERAVALGIVNGYEDGTFRPSGEISRAEFTAMIGRALKLKGSEAKLAFADADHIPLWVKPLLANAVEAGIISSYEDGTFRAGRQITRSEIAVIVVRALNLPLDAGDALPFADAGQIPEWASPYVAAAFQKGIINGRDYNLFAPNDSATRAEAVTLVISMLNDAK
ncbi:NEAT domain-containing protein [Paenibacillus piri]|nr:NEAT domain-containing protein [Paenibacillus piri]